jgi:photosystem II stability/assembly factor-like uncharacterized protein
MTAKFTIAFIFQIVFASAVFSQWVKLENTEAYKGKQDDIFFIDENIGWYVNGLGKIFKTYNAGKNWKEILNKPGTYFRCIGFTDSLHGFVGNIGTDYFPNVTDTIPLYETFDGGKNWQPVASLLNKHIKGLCAIDIQTVKYINAGMLDKRTIIYAGGRVGSPAWLVKSIDGGKTFTPINMNENCKMILDVKFFGIDTGFVFAANNDDVEKSNALILQTFDGGKSWLKRYESTRPYELTWKGSFPSRKVGYSTIQSYNPDSIVTQRFIVKTIDGGLTWNEIPLCNDLNIREFGIGFINENKGWVGTNKIGFETNDGGVTWTNVDIGKAVNKIRILKTLKKVVAYAIGSNIYKYE